MCNNGFLNIPLRKDMSAFLYEPTVYTEVFPENVKIIKLKDVIFTFHFILLVTLYGLNSLIIFTSVISLIFTYL